MLKDIGGYIELELQKGQFLHQNAIALNSGRNCIRYIIRAYGIKEIHVPIYECPRVWDAIEAEGCKIKFYHIDKNLMPDCKFNEDDYILYSNYYGVCSGNIKKLVKKYKNLIVDNAQSYFMKPMGIATAYSPRKFFGVPDGGLVYCNKQLDELLEQDHDSYKRFSHLLKRVEFDSNAGYPDFKINDESLDGQEIKTMSNLTSFMISQSNEKQNIRKRLENFKYLKKALDKYNLFKCDLKNEVPMFYPFLYENAGLRKYLHNNHIYVSTFWERIEEKCSTYSYEMYLKDYMYPLIIDQRYDIEDMKLQASLIKDFIENEPQDE